MTDFLWPIRVYYEDTDAAGVVYYANYLKFMERARTEYIRSLGFEQDDLREQQAVIFVVRNVTMQLHRPAQFNDELEVVSNIHGIARTHLSFKQVIRRGDEAQLLCEADIQVVCIDAKIWKPRAIPPEMLLGIK